jgi:hypothetical protein
MKKLWVILFVLAIFSNSTRAGRFFQELIRISPPTTDTFLVTIVNDITVIPIKIWDINLRANRDFVRRFPSAENAEWFKLQDGYMVCFAVQDKSSRIGYDKKGNWLYDMHSYPIASLPKEVRHSVTYSYPDSKLLQANEIKKSKEIIYIIQISERERIKTIWYSDGEMHTLND